MFEKILLPLDGSELAETAIPYVRDLAGQLGGRGLSAACLSAGTSSLSPYASNLSEQHGGQPPERDQGNLAAGTRSRRSRLK